MKKILKLFLRSIKSLDGSKRPEEIEDWKELMDNLVWFLLAETAIVLLFITPFVFLLFNCLGKEGSNLLLFTFCLFTIANFMATMLLTITEVVIVFMKKRERRFNKREEDAPDWSLRLKAWSFEHPPWV